MSNFFKRTAEGIDFTLYGWTPTDERPEPKVYLSMQHHPLDAHTTMSPDEARRLAALLKMAADEADGKDERILQEETILALLDASGPQSTRQIQIELETQLGFYASPLDRLRSMAKYGTVIEAEEPDTWESSK